MHLTPLGSHAGMPGNGIASSGYLVRADSTMLMLDAGPGTAVALSRHLDEQRPDALFISHQHADHILDVLPIGKMLLSRRLTQDGGSGAITIDESTPRVPLFVPEGAAAVLHRLAALFPVTTHPILDRALDLAFDLREYRPGDRHTVGGLRLRFELLRHASPNCGIRIESEHASLVYTGDTGVTDALPELAEGVDTLLSESTLRETDTSGHGHLSSADAGRAAREAQVGALVLTHLSSTDPVEHSWHTERAAGEFDGPIAIATPHQSITIGSNRKVPV